MAAGQAESEFFEKKPMRMHALGMMAALLHFDL